MQRNAMFGIAVSVVLAGILAARAGTAAALDPLRNGVGLCILEVSALQLVSLALCAIALRCVTPGTSLVECVAARWVRDGASNLVAFVPGLGEIAGTRAFVLLDTSVSLAVSGTICDLAVEAMAQAVYTLIGLGVLLCATTQDERVHWLVALATVCGFVLATHYFTHHHGALAASERLFAKLVASLRERFKQRLPINFAALRAIPRDRNQIVVAFLVHLAAWMAGAIQVWAVARAIDHPVGLGVALVMESLTCAARGVLFLVPWGLGIQEGGSPSLVPFLASMLQGRWGCR